MTTFGELSDTIAAVILAKLHFACHIHVVPDRYDVEDSMKSGERSRQSQWKAIEIEVQNREAKLPVSLKPVTCDVGKKTNPTSCCLQCMYAD